MQKKHKMTGCARLFLVLLVIAPLAYLGAAYYNGQNGIQNIKNFLGIGAPKENDPNDIYEDPTMDMKEALAEKEKEIQKLKDENSHLRKEIDALKAELEKLKGTGQ